MKTKFPFFLFFLLFLFSFSKGFSQKDSLRKQITSFLKDKSCEVGVAIYEMEKGDTLTFGNSKQYPMQSVYKFHLALAILNEVDKGKLDLQQKIKITKADLQPNTWSPLREKYPNGAEELSLQDVLRYNVSMSDNNACDILFRLVGGTKKVHKYMRSLGIKEVAIKGTEAQMHADWQMQFRNCTSPFATVELLNQFYKKNILSQHCKSVLWDMLVNCTTAPDRIKGKLPENALVGHKTGTSDRTKEGVKIAQNDIGIMVLPNGKNVAIAVFVTNSKETDEKNAEIIAEIAKMTWVYFAK